MIFNRLLNLLFLISIITSEIICFSNFGMFESMLLNFIFALFVICIFKIHAENKQVKKVISLEQKILKARELEYLEAKMLYKQQPIADEF